MEQDRQEQTQEQEQEQVQEQNTPEQPAPEQPAPPAEGPIEKKPFPKKAVMIGAAVVVVLIAVLLAVFLHEEPLKTQAAGGISCGVPESWEVRQEGDALKCEPAKEGGDGMLRVFYLETGLSVETEAARKELWEKEDLFSGEPQGDMKELALDGVSLSPACAYRFPSKLGGKTYDCCYLFADYANGQAVVGLEVLHGSDLEKQGEKLFNRVAKSLTLNQGEEQKLIDGHIAEFEKAAEPLQEITLESAPDIDAAQELYDSFSPIVQKAIPDGEKLLNSGREAYDQKVDEAAQDMMERIDAVGEVTLEKKDQIEALVREYDALPKEVREKVNRPQVLMGYLDDIDSLEREEQEKKAIAEVEEAINAIGEVTLESGPAIDAAEEKWDALSKSLREKVSNSDAFWAARDKYYEMREAKKNADKKQELLNSCVQITYDQLARNPDDYFGKYIWFKGEIVQVVDNYHFRVNITQGAYTWSDTVYVNIPFDSIKEFEGKLLEDDIITVYGKGEGTKSYTSVLGASITIPEVTAELTMLGS